MKKSNTFEFIEKAKKIHGEKYDYSKFFYINNYTKSNIICPKHGEFLQTATKHLSKRGCPKCGDTTLTLLEFINKAKEIHNDKYDYSKSNYVNYNSKLNIICPIHGEFKQLVGNHLSGKGCPKCKFDNTSKIKRKPITEFIIDAYSIHGERYDYSESKYKRNSNRINIKCKIHGNFYQRIQHHLDGHGCPKCHHRISKPENEFLNYLKINKSKRQLNINRHLIDGLKGKTIYEFLGDFWHGNPKKFKRSDIHPYIKKSFGELYKNTILKLEKLKSLGYNVKYIWENDWKNFKKGIVNEPNIQTL